MLKKILTLALVITVLILPTANAALTDIAGNTYEKDIAILNALGILQGDETGAFKPDDALSRAEMVTIALRLINVQGAEAAKFEDVPGDHWASLAIGTAVSLGLVNGVSETRFAPEDKLTYPQAVKILVCALGYEVQAQVGGGYPGGYLAVASRLGILKGTEDDGQPVKRAVMAKIVASAAEAQILVRTSYGNSLSFTEKEGATILSEYLNIFKFKGKITANDTSAVEGTTAKDGCITLDKETSFKVGATDAARRLGREVTIYAHAEDDVYTILYIEDKATTKVITIDAENIGENSTTTTICYMENGTEKKVSVLADATWIVNDTKKTADAAYFDMDIGTMELISSSGSTVDTVKITSFKNLIVDTVRQDTKKVTFKNGTAEGVASLELDPDSSDYKLTFVNADGTAAAVEALVEWDVLSVAQGDDTLYVIRSGNKVNGAVTEVSTKTVSVSGATRTVADKVTIGGTTYEVAANVARGNASGEIGNIGVGTEAAFLLDYTGKIVGFDGEAYRDFMYGWIINIGTEKGISGKYQVKIFTENGEMKIFTLAERFTYNDFTKKEISAAATPELYTGDEVKGQIVTFKANGDELQELNTKTEAETIFTNNSGGMYGAPMRAYSMKYLVREKTKVFIVPEVYTKDSDYTMMDPMKIPHLSDSKLPNVYAYDLGDDNVIGVMVSIGAASGEYSTVGVVKGFVTMLDGDGMEAEGIAVYTRNGESTIMLDEDIEVVLGSGAITDVTKEPEMPEVPTLDTTGRPIPNETISVDKINVGDVIWYSNPNFNNKVTKMRVIARAETPFDDFVSFGSGSISEKPSKTSMYNLFSFTQGTVKSVSKYAAIVSHEIEKYIHSNKNEIMQTESALVFEGANTIVLYDKDRNKFSTITGAEIYEGDRVFSYRSNLRQMFMVVYR